MEKECEICRDKFVVYNMPVYNPILDVALLNQDICVHCKLNIGALVPLNG